MLVPTYCAGSRRGELARLDLVDVDLQKGPITVRQTKFFKSRILPLPDSVRTELRAYIKARRIAGSMFWSLLARAGPDPPLHIRNDHLAAHERHTARRVEATARANQATR